MRQFILGYPKNKEQSFEYIAEYTNMQDAGSMTTNFCAIYADSLLSAKIKLTLLRINNFEPLNFDHLEQS